MARPYGIVYLITNLLNEKYYVGQTTGTLSYRWSVHKSEARKRAKSYLHKAIARYGEANFAIRALAEASGRDELNNLEKIWVLATRASNPEFGYNLTSGGDFGGFPNETTRRKMSVAARARVTDESLARWRAMLESQKGQKFSAEHKRNLSAANKGKSPSELCRQRVAEANRKRVVSPETRAKLRAAAAKANLIRWNKELHPDTRHKIREASLRNIAGRRRDKLGRLIAS